MKNLFILFALIVSLHSFAQKNHSECVAVFHEDDMVVDEFSPRGKSVVSKQTKGNLTVNLVKIGDEIVKRDSVSFYIAIKDVETQTLTMVSTNPTYFLDLKSVTSKRKEGDKIVLILNDSKYALPTEQHEILIVE